jgi:CBS domain-containing protein
MGPAPGIGGRVPYRWRAARDSSALPVVNGRGRVLGVVSEADLLDNSQRLADGQGAATAGEVMASPAVTVTPQATVTEAPRRMLASGLKRLPWWPARAGRSASSAARTCSGR